MAQAKSSNCEGVILDSRIDIDQCPAGSAEQAHAIAVGREDLKPVNSDPCLKGRGDRTYHSSSEIASEVSYLPPSE